MHVHALISEIKKYPLLFDRKDPENKILLSRDIAWKSISAAVGEPPQKCKLRWKTLKDKFVKDSREGEGNEPSRWKHHQVMSFLYDYLDIRRRPSFRPKRHIQESFMTNEKAISFLSPNDQSREETLDSFLDETMEFISPNDNDNHNPEPMSEKEKNFDFMSCETTSKDPKKKHDHEYRDQFYDLMGRLTNISEKLVLDSEEKEDGFYKFLQSILKNVDKRSQDRIKIEILNLTNERVDEILSANQE